MQEGELVLLVDLSLFLGEGDARSRGIVLLVKHFRSGIFRHCLN